MGGVHPQFINQISGISSGLIIIVTFLISIFSLLNLSKKSLSTYHCKHNHFKNHYKKNGLLLTHCKVDDFHQEVDCQVVLILYKLALKSMYPIL